MAKVQGIKEKLHWPLYDAFVVPDQNGTGANAPTFQSEMDKRDSRILRFFVDVQSKTRLETNLQASSTLPSLNSYEVRAMRVVVSPVLRYARKKDEPSPDTDNVLADLIYNSVTSLIVGEKTMIEMPTYYFPAGAGVSPGNQSLPSHGQPDPMATFRFSEPVPIEPNQNFRVEMNFPQSVPSGPARLGNATGPLRLWVVLDGYLTRDVQ